MDDRKLAAVWNLNFGGCDARPNTSPANDPALFDSVGGDEEMTDIVERLYANTDFSTGMNLAQEAAREIERLRQVCRNAYEVWAGSEGIPEPETAAEAYLLQLLIQMRDEVKRGL